MSHTGGPVHLSLEDKTSQRKEWPNGNCARSPAGPCGWDGCTWQAERGRSTTSGRPDVRLWVGHVNGLTCYSFLTCSLNISLIYVFLLSPISLSFLYPSFLSLIHFVFLIPLVFSPISWSIAPIFLILGALFFHFSKNFHSWSHLSLLNDPLPPWSHSLPAWFHLPFFGGTLQYPQPKSY